MHCYVSVPFSIMSIPVFSPAVPFVALPHVSLLPLHTVSLSYCQVLNSRRNLGDSNMNPGRYNQQKKLGGAFIGD